MEKLKSTAKSIWAKIPKTKTEFKYLFDKCVSFIVYLIVSFFSIAYTTIKTIFILVWFFLNFACAWIIKFYQKHSKLIHKCLYAIAILIWFAVLVIILINLYELYFAKEKADSWASEVRIAVFTLAAWFGTPFLVWRTMIAAKQANTAQEKAYTELFTHAIEQLGSEKPETTTIKDKNGELIVDEAGRPLTEEKYVPNIEVRVGALYALERIMHASDKDAKTIIDTLTTYVKHNCGEPRIFEKEITEEDVKELQEKAPANRYDIQIALTIIGRRPPKYKTKETMPDLTKVNLQGENLVKFDLSLCNFSNAYLDGAELQRADLQGAALFMAELQRADLQGADLQGANLQEANLQEANLRGANLQEANLQEANLRGANLQEANLQEANLRGANLHEANLQEANLQEANLRGAYLQGANLRGAYLQGANLRGADLLRANLQRAKLQWAELQRAKLQWAELQKAELQGANLQKANLYDVQITDAHKTAASVIWVDFTKTKYDFDRLQEQVMDMFGHKTKTILPEGMTVPDHWSEADMDTDKGQNQYDREWEAFKEKMRVG